MKYLIILVLATTFCGCQNSPFLQHKQVKLSPPNIFVKDVFFKDSTLLEVVLTPESVDVVYSISNRKYLYKKPIAVKENAVITIHSEGGGYLPSNPQNIQVVKLPEQKILSIRSDRTLDDKYGRGGLSTLIDQKKGSADFNNEWLGYPGDTIVYKLEFKEREINQVMVSTLRNQNAWIFSPATVNIYCEGTLIQTLETDNPILKKANRNEFNEIYFSKINTNHLTVEIIAPHAIPSWHPGSGGKPWVFIDEILIF